MSQRAGTPQQPVEDAAARRVGARRGAASPLTRALRELGKLDKSAYHALARTPSPAIDNAFRRLSVAADHSFLWCGIAGAMSVLGGSRGRRAAAGGLLAIGTTSLTVNRVVKPLARRERPARAESATFGARHVPMPGSTSFPSGHSASAFAFAFAVGRDLPQVAVPIGLLAAAVAHSRVHTGVHYPSDVVLGSVLGAGVAAVLAAARPGPAATSR